MGERGPDPTADRRETPRAAPLDPGAADGAGGELPLEDRTGRELPPVAVRTPATDAPLAELARRTLVVTGIVTTVLVALLLVWSAVRVLLLVFAGALVALLVSTMARAIAEHSPIPYRLSLAIVLASLVALVTAAVDWRGPAVAEQVSALREALPAALDELRGRLERYPWARRFLRDTPSAAQLVEQLMSGDGSLLTRARSLAATLLGVLTTVFVIVFTALYIAAEPRTYAEGVIRLVPPARRDRAREVLGAVVSALRWWLLAKLASMLIIGIGTGIGLYLLGIPLVFTLGLLAAMLTFIPNIGPILSAFPAILLALLEGPMLALWVALLYYGVQAVESYLITPYLERRTVKLPPALTLGVQVVLGLSAGLLGLALAAPLTAVGIVLVQTLYVQDMLGDWSHPVA